MTHDPDRNQTRRARFRRGLILAVSVFLVLGAAMSVAPGLRASASSGRPPPVTSGPPSPPNDARYPPRTTQGARPSAPFPFSDSSPTMAKRKSPVVGPESPSAAQAIIGWEYDQIAPAVAYGSGLNQYLVVWEDYYLGQGSNSDIYGRRVSYSGVPVGSAFPIAETGNRRLAPDVAHNYTWQDYLVVWEYEWSSADHDIYARRVDYDGTLLSGEIAIDFSTNYDRNPVVAYSPLSDGYLVVWERRVGDPEFPQWDIYARMLDWDGTPLGSAFALDTGNASQEHPAIAYNSAWDEYLVIWQDRTAGNWDIMGRRVDGDGTLLGGEFVIEAPGHDQTWPDIAYNHNRKEYLIVWEDRIGGSSTDWDIKAWRRNIAGSPIAWHLVSSSGTQRRMKPAVAYNFQADEYFVTYEYEYSASDLDIMQSRLRWDGVARQTDVFISWTYDEARPAVASGKWSNLVVWEDDRNAGSMGIDIYGDLVKVYGLEGSVYGGFYPETSSPLAGVDLALFCSSTPGEWGTYRELTTTDSSGSYTLVDYGPCSYYNIGMYTPTGYQEWWASSTGGTVINSHWIQYSGSLEGKILTGNNFWVVPQPPPPPTNVAASDGTYNDRVRVTWGGSSGATYYQVYRATSAGGTKSLLGSPTGMSWDDTTAAAGTTYYYWVTACNLWLCSGYSAYDTGYRTAPPPAAPTGVDASDGTYTDRVRVMWNSSSGATYYQVWRATSAGGGKTLLGSPTGSPYDDTSAAVGTTYYYWARACNTWGCSGYSAYNTGYRSGVPPPAPTGVDASDGTYTDRVRVMWNAASGATYYQVWRATSAGGGKTLLGSPTGSPYDDTSATVGTTYYYWARACNTWGCSGYSAHNTGYRSGVPPPAPTGVDASDGTYTDRVRVMWNAASGATYYEVYRATSSGGTKSLLGSPASSPFDDMTAVVGTTYYYWVVACNTWGCSDFSAYDTGERSGVPPEPPANVEASDLTYTDRVQVTWDSVADATYYEVYRATSSGGVKSLLGSPAGSPYDDTSAVVGTTYYYWVKACNTWGCSDFSAYDTGERSGVPPEPPANVEASDGTYTETVRVAWDGSEGATYYEVYRAESEGGVKTPLASPAGTSYDDDSAVVGTTYYYWLVACNTWGCSGYSAHDTGYRSGVPPEAPANVLASDGTYTETVRVAWDGSEGATYYEVYRAESAGGSKTLQGSPTGSPYDDTSAVVGTTYYYWVAACNIWGCSDYSAYDTGYRSGVPPEPPENVEASDGTYTDRVEVMWDSAADATYYEVYRAESAGGVKTLLGSPTGSPYDDTTAVVGTTYYYWVAACNIWGCSDYSAYDTGYSPWSAGAVSGRVILERRVNYPDANAGVEVRLAGQLLVTGDDGTYMFSEVPVGTHAISATHPSYLPTWRNVEVTGGATAALPDVTMLGGDCGAGAPQGDIYHEDGTDIALAWDSSPGDGHWNPRVDIRDDEVIDVLDLTAVRFNWRRSAPGPWPGTTAAAEGGGWQLREPSLGMQATAESTIVVSPTLIATSAGVPAVAEIWVQDVEGFYGGAFVLNFDSSVVEVRDANPYQDGVQIESGSWLELQLELANSVDSTAGEVDFGVTQHYPATGKDGSGILARITFVGVADGISALEFSQWQLADDEGGIIAASAQDGEVVVRGGSRLYLPLVLRDG